MESQFDLDSAAFSMTHKTVILRKWLNIWRGDNGKRKETLKELVSSVDLFPLPVMNVTYANKN